MNKEKIEKLLKDYKRNHHIYVEFAECLKPLFIDVLNSEELEYLSVDVRAKSPESLRAKLESGIINPRTVEGVQDLVGVRIITYVYEDILKIEELISRCFKSKILEVAQRLGTDRVGYMSHHHLINLSADRLKLIEYKKFKGLGAELQIRTILQHAWAQIGHNQIYKPNVVLPNKIKRDFTLLSGLLEIADNEFGRISKEISNYSDQVEERTDKGDLDVSIDSISIRRYFDSHFGSSEFVDPKFGPNDDMAEKIIEELKIMGVETLRQLNEIIPKDLNSKIEEFDKKTNYCGVARNIMIVSNPEKYFSDAWGNSWGIASHEAMAIYTAYGIDVEKLIARYSVKK